MAETRADVPSTYICAECGGTFESEQSDEWSDDKAHTEAVRTYGVRGDAPAMAIVCDDCYQAIMARVKN